MFAQIALFCTPLCASAELNVREYLMKAITVRPHNATRLRESNHLSLSEKVG